MFMHKYLLTNNVAHAIENVSNLSFGIYLMHIYFLTEISWRLCDYLQLIGVLQIILTTMLTFTLSFLVSWGISKLPYSQFVIGYKQKK